MHDENPNAVSYAASTGVILFLLVSGISLVATLILLSTGHFFVENEADISTYSYLILILGIKSAILFPLFISYAIVMAKERFDYMSTIQLAALVGRVFFIYYFISNGYDVIALAYIVSITDILTSLLMLWLATKLHPNLKIGLKYFSSKKLKSYYNWGKYTYLSVIAQKITHSTDDLIVASIISVSALTHYAIAAALIGYFGELVASIFGVILPTLNRLHKTSQDEELRKTIFNTTDLSSILSLYIGGMLILLGEPFIRVWVGSNYNDSYMLLIILSIPAIFMNMQRPISSALFATGQHQAYTISLLLSALANLGLSIILCYEFGLIGVALGTLISTASIYFIFLPINACSNLGISIKTYYYFIAKRIFFTLLFFASAYPVVHAYNIESYFSLILTSIILTIIYLLLAYVLVFTKNTKSSILDIISSIPIKPKSMKFK